MVAIQELVKKVFEMRKLQKRYFRCKERNNLLAAMSAELEVDNALEQLGLRVDERPAKCKATKKTESKLF